MVRRLLQRHPIPDATLALVAYDVKIKPNGEGFFPEKNGSNFGSKGFDADHPFDDVLIEYLTSFGLPVTVVAQTYKHTAGNNFHAATRMEQLSGGRIRAAFVTPEQRDANDFSSLGLESIVRGGRRRRQAARKNEGRRYKTTKHVPTSLQEYERIILNRTCRRVIFDEGRFLVANPMVLNGTLQDKKLLDVLGYKQNLPVGINAQRGKPHGRALRELVTSSDTRRYILKPSESSLGVGIRVIDRSQLFSGGRVIPDIFALQDRQGPVIDPQYGDVLIEEFAESTPIRSDITGRDHDGCMRYIVGVTTEKGRINVTHLGGYWRLCPAALDDTTASPERRLKANLSDGALPQRATLDHLLAAQRAVDAELEATHYRFLVGNPAAPAPVSFGSDTSFLERTTRSRALRARRPKTLREYTIAELQKAPHAVLEQIRDNENVGEVPQKLLRQEMMDRACKEHFNGAYVFLDIRDLDADHIATMHHDVAYATAAKIHLFGRARLSPAELRKRLLANHDAVARLRFYNSDRIVSLDHETLDSLARATRKLQDGKRYKREALVRHALDYKVLLSEQPFAPAADTTVAGLARLPALQLYELAIQYGISTRASAVTDNRLDEAQLRTMLENHVAETPKLSVFVDAYDTGMHLEESLQSILQQKVQGGVEVCVVADGTDPKTNRAIRKMQQAYREEGKTLRVRFAYGAQPHNTAYQEGLALCKGDYIVTMRGNDRIRDGETDTTVLSKMARVLDRSDAYDSVHGRHDFINQDGSIAGRRRLAAQKQSNHYKPFVMFRRGLYEDLKDLGIDTLAEGKQYHPDVELGIKLSYMVCRRGTRARHLPETLYEERMQPHDSAKMYSGRQHREIGDALADAERLSQKLFGANK